MRFGNDAPISSIGSFSNLAAVFWKKQDGTAVDRHGRGKPDTDACSDNARIGKGRRAN
jgi:hypothetical protein